MKKLLSLCLIFTMICSFNCFAAVDSNNYNSVIYGGNTNFSEAFYNNKFNNNYITEYNGTAARIPATIRINPNDNINLSQYIQGGPLTFINTTKYEVVLNDGAKQLFNRIKFHYVINKDTNATMNTMIIKLNGIPIVQESFNTLNEDDFYVWIYKPGNVDIEFFSWDLLHGVPGQSILNISNIEAYNG